MARPRTQLLYINSKNRRKGGFSDKPYDFHLQLEHGLVKLDKPGIITVTVLDVVMPRSWYSVTSNNDKFYINDAEGWREATLNHGSYNVYQLRQELERVLQLFNGAWAVSYDKIGNKYKYQPPPYDSITPWSFSFPTTQVTHELLGFDQSEQPNGTGITPFTSTMPVKVSPESAVLIHANLPKVKFTVADNIHVAAGKTNFAESDILMKVPITVGPHDNIVYMAQGADLVSFELSTHQIHDLHIWVTDECNRQILLQHDWSMTLKFDYEEYIEVAAGSSSYTGKALDLQHAALEDVSSIKQYLQLLILSTTKLSSQ